MTIRLHILIICTLFLSCIGVSQSFCQEEHTAVLCDVLKVPASFDGREIVVSGVAGNSFHQVDFWDPECSLLRHGGAMLMRFSDDYRMGQPEDKKYLRLLRKEGAVEITVRGKFVSSGGPFGPEGTRYEFLISSIIEVNKLSMEYRQKFDIGSGQVAIVPR
jgi:hypothetical protein